jgi:hypothetical protein
MKTCNLIVENSLVFCVLFYGTWECGTKNYKLHVSYSTLFYVQFPTSSSVRTKKNPQDLENSEDMWQFSTTFKYVQLFFSMKTREKTTENHLKDCNALSLSLTLFLLSW